MIVVDAGAWALALTSSSSDAAASRDVLSADTQWAMPAHGPVETLRFIRRFESAGYLTTDDAEECIDEICAAEIRLAAPERPLLRQIWELRHNVSPYDAAYVILAGRYGCRLVTLDKRLARAASTLGVSTTVPGATAPGQ